MPSPPLIVQKTSRQTFEIHQKTNKKETHTHNGANKIFYAHNFQQLINKISNKRETAKCIENCNGYDDVGHQQRRRQQYKITNLQ